MNDFRTAKCLLIPVALLGLSACIAPHATTPKVTPRQHLTHNGKQLVLIRIATRTEAEAAARKLIILPGDEVWYYETSITEMMAGEIGFCVVRAGVIVSRFATAAV